MKKTNNFYSNYEGLQGRKRLGDFKWKSNITSGDRSLMGSAGTHKTYDDGIAGWGDMDSYNPFKN